MYMSYVYIDCAMNKITNIKRYVLVYRCIMLYIS